MFSRVPQLHGVALEREVNRKFNERDRALSGFTDCDVEPRGKLVLKL
jgi:hypothetical protein